MIAFENLTLRGKARRLRQLALLALGQYDLNVTAVRLVGFYTNTLFRVFTDRPSSYLLRICSPGWRTDEDLRSEVMWLQALHHDTDIGAPVPLPARNGEYIVKVGCKGFTGPQRCMVMSWLPGQLLGHDLTEKNLFQMGVLFARLHEHTAGFTPPTGFTRRKMDNLYPRGEEDILSNASCQDAFSPGNRIIFEQTRQRVDDAYAQLYADPAGLRVIHNDLHHDNIKIFHGRLYPFDFEDTVWGYPVQDIAMSLQDLMVAVHPEAFESLLNAFRQGYESRCLWPESNPGQIDTFRAGRLLWVANYVARYERPHLQGYVSGISGMLERFLMTGVLRIG